MDAQKLRVLSPRHRALVSIAVLLDGREAAAYLQNDSDHGTALERAAMDIAGQDPEIRMPFLGTILRSALRDIK